MTFLGGGYSVTVEVSSLFTLMFNNLILFSSGTVLKKNTVFEHFPKLLIQ